MFLHSGLGGGRRASLSASVSWSAGRMLGGRTVLLLLKIEEILESAGREEDRYSISVFLPNFTVFHSISFFIRWIFILPTSTENNCIPFLSDWPSYHFFFFLFRNFCTGMYKVVLRCLSSRHGTCAAAFSRTSYEYMAGAVLAMVVRKFQIWTSLSLLLFLPRPMS